jgi:hypothetical protein
MAMKEAGVDAAQSFREELLKDNENNAEGVDVNIDVSAIMQDPITTTRSKIRAAPFAPGGPVVLPPRRAQRARRR